MVSTWQGPLLSPARQAQPRLGGFSWNMVRKGKVGHSHGQDPSLKGMEAAEVPAMGTGMLLPASAQGSSASLPLQIRYCGSLSEPLLLPKEASSLSGQPLPWPPPSPDEGPKARSQETRSLR